MPFLSLFSGSKVIKILAMLNSPEHEISNAHKYKNIKRISIFSGSDEPITLFFMFINVKMHFNIYLN